MKAIGHTARNGSNLLIAFVILSALLLSRATGQKRSAPRPVPGTPTGVIAVPLQEAAVVAWLLPVSQADAPPITSYTVTAFDTSAPSSVVTTARADAPGAEIQGLNPSHCYSFRVHAANIAGEGPDSDASEPVCLPSAPGADLAIKVSASKDASNDSTVTFMVTVTNNGVADAPMVTVEDNLVTPLSSFDTTQGVCQPTAGGIGLRCNLGAVSTGAYATITVTVPMTGAEISNTAVVKALDAAGSPLADPVPANNTASATIHPQAE